jgi:hypothetical protein
MEKGAPPVQNAKPMVLWNVSTVRGKAILPVPHVMGKDTKAVPGVMEREEEIVAIVMGMESLTTTTTERATMRI